MGRKGGISKFREIQILEHNSVPYNFSVRKFFMRRLNLNTRKQLLAILKFSILSGKIDKFKKSGFLSIHPEKCFVESTKISIGPYLNEKLC